MSRVPLYVNRLMKSDDERRGRIFDGALFLYSAPTESTRIIEWARECVTQAFGKTGDVRRAHQALKVEEFAKIASSLKTRFTNDPATKKMCQDLIMALGCDPDRTYFDLPRLRVAPPGDYLTTGVSYSYKAHRDTWYAHPTQLINYWVPVYDSEVSTVMSMFLEYFHRPVANTSGEWDYDNWVQNARYAAVQNIGIENRQHPLPTQSLEEALDIRVVQNAGDLMLFSTCHLHSSAPNLTDCIRYSYDLRTIHLDDLCEGRGPENIDGRATGSTLKDFLRVSDLAPLNEEIGAVCSRI